MNNGRPVILVGHSMGCPVVHAFLNTVGKDWKARYVRTFVGLEGPWLGAPKALKTLFSGESFGTPVKGHVFQKMETTFESGLYLLPQADLWPADYRQLISIEKPLRNYSVFDYVALLRDLNISAPESRLEFLQKRQRTLKAPGVEVVCVYGFDMATPYGYVYKTPGDINPAISFTGNGDGTVPLHSLRYCEQWRAQQSQPVVLKGFVGLEHLQAAKSTKVIRYVAEVVKRVGKHSQA